MLDTAAAERNLLYAQMTGLSLPRVPRYEERTYERVIKRGGNLDAPPAVRGPRVMCGRCYPFGVRP